jgi:hypothetical protein
MTDAERDEWSGPKDASEPQMVVREDGKLALLGASFAAEPELSNEEEKRLLDDMKAKQEQEKVESLALAERLGCGIYLAAYLRFLNSKFEVIADTSGKVRTQELPKKIIRRKP